MSGLDYFILAVLLISAVAGLIRGFIKEVCMLVAWVLAFWLAWQLGPVLEPHLGGALKKTPYAAWAARAIIFFLVLAIGALVAALVAHLTRLSLFKGTDRLLGFLLGVVRGVIILGIVGLLGQTLNLEGESWWKKSKLAPYLSPVTQGLRTIVGDYLPRDVKL